MRTDLVRCGIVDCSQHWSASTEESAGSRPSGCFAHTFALDSGFSPLEKLGAEHVHTFEGLRNSF